MPYQNVVALERAQAKIEAVRGTPETTMTRWMRLEADGSSFSIDQPHDLTMEMLGSFQPYQNLQLLGRRARLSIAMILSYEELVWWLNHFSKGSALTGTTTGSTPPGYTYTNSPDASVDNIATSTWKVGDGAVVYKLSRCVVNTASIRCNITNEGTWRLTAEMFGVYEGTTTFDAPAELTRTKIVSFGFKTYLDTTLAIGTTQLTGRVRSFTVNYQLNIEEKQFGEDGYDAAPDFARGWYIVTVDLPTEHTDQTLVAHAESNTAVKLRFEQTGPQIGTTPTTNYRVRIDLPQAKLSWPALGRAGLNKIATFAVTAEKPAGAACITHEVINALATVAA